MTRRGALVLASAAALSAAAMAAYAIATLGRYPHSVTSCTIGDDRVVITACDVNFLTNGAHVRRFSGTERRWSREFTDPYQPPALARVCFAGDRVLLASDGGGNCTGERFRWLVGPDEAVCCGPECPAENRRSSLGSAPADVRCASCSSRPPTLTEFLRDLPTCVF
jgi:hypothetical protein